MLESHFTDLPLGAVMFHANELLGKFQVCVDANVCVVMPDAYVSVLLAYDRGLSDSDVAVAQIGMELGVPEPDTPPPPPPLLGG